VLEAYVTKTRDKAVVLKFLRELMKRHGRAGNIVTDGLRSYGAALKDMGAEGRQVTGRWENNRAENSHQPFRRREGDAALQADAQFPEVCLSPLLMPQPLQLRPEPLQPRDLQAGPRRRSGRAAGPVHELRSGIPAQTETSSYSSDSTRELSVGHFGGQAACRVEMEHVNWLKLK
jgi:hypothetical protein